MLSKKMNRSMSRLKLAYFGDGPWSHEALLKLAARPNDFEIVFVVPRFDYQDPKLCDLAQEMGLDVRVFENVNSVEALEEIRGFNLDLVVSMSFNQILKAPFLALPRIGTVNCHAGALPKYRGRNVLNWALINGESEFGVTAHFVDTGIDTGDILHQEIVPIKMGSNFSDVLALAYEVCPRVLIAALDKLINGTACPQPQADLGLGFYCGRRRPGDEWIDWSWSAEKIVNFVRAISPPGPGAITALKGQLIKVLDASFNPDSPPYLCNEGEIVGGDSQGVWVKASDRVVRLNTCQNVAEYASFTPQWRIGTRFLNKLEYRLEELEAKKDIKKY